MKTNKGITRTKILVLLMVLSLVLTACGQKGGGSKEGDTTNDGADSTVADDVKDDDQSEDDEVEKPEKITIMVDGTLVTKENGRDAFEKEWEELTGIELEIIQPDHDAYTDNLGQTLASGNWPDVVLLNSAYYAGYAEEGVLWDMTEAYDNS